MINSYEGFASGHPTILLLTGLLGSILFSLVTQTFTQIILNSTSVSNITLDLELTITTVMSLSMFFHVAENTMA